MKAARHANARSSRPRVKGMPAAGRLVRVIMLGAALGTVPAPASAAQHRVAVLIGNNRGQIDEVELLYADKDVQKIGEVLKRYGSFPAENVTHLFEANAGQVREALVTINDRIRRDIQDGHDVLLLVYYSGHADKKHLHLGETELSFEELTKLVGGSAATSRMLILDSCHSGSLTRVKGGVPSEEFDIVTDDLSSEGTVFIASSAANEKSQESDEVQGSVFTHYLVSALLGAADYSRDGKVSLSEAYGYSHQQTIKATSRTRGGTQHPTYLYDNLKGQGDFIFTDLNQVSGDPAYLVFPSPGNFLILEESDDGAVVAEVSTAEPGSRLALRPGRYLVRQRARHEIIEGYVDLRPRQSTMLDTSDFEKIRYARLVRKGGGQGWAHGPAVHYRYQGSIIERFGPTAMLGLSYPLTLQWGTVAPRLSFGRARPAGRAKSSTDEVVLVVEVTRVFDWSRVSFAVGPEIGVAHLRQRFEELANPSTLASTGIVFGGIASVGVEIAGGFYIQLSAEALSHVIRVRGSDGKKGISTPQTYVFGFSVGRTFIPRDH